MSAYLDASALVPMFLDDAFSERMDVFLESAPEMHVSDFAAAEFASAIGLKVRTGEVTEAEAREALADFDHWKAAATVPIETGAQDIRTADAILRRLDFSLRTPDALHVAIVQRLGSDLVTFDDRMAASARALGLTVTIP